MTVIAHDPDWTDNTALNRLVFLHAFNTITDEHHDDVKFDAPGKESRPYSCLLDDLQFLEVQRVLNENKSGLNSTDSIQKPQSHLVFKFYYTRTMAEKLKKEAEIQARRDAERKRLEDEAAEAYRKKYEIVEQIK